MATIKKKKKSCKTPSKKNTKRCKPAKKATLPSHFIWEKASVAEAVSAVISHLQAAQVQSVLVGPACAALYVSSLHPKSIDLIVREYNVLVMNKLMKDLGYKEVELRSFVSLRSPYAIHFFPPPVTVGDAHVHSFKLYKQKGVHFPMLNEIDCVRHRLSQWYHWGEEDALRDALVLSKKFQPDQNLLARWSELEWAKEKYIEFRRLLDEQR